MNRIFQSGANTLLFRLSDAAEHYKTCNGRFEVIYQKTRRKDFSSLKEAFIFYMMLDEEADLLDTSLGSILIESKIRLHYFAN